MMFGRKKYCFWGEWRDGLGRGPAIGGFNSTHYFVLKPTRDEIFSERYGHRKVHRFAGWSLTFDKKISLPPNPTQHNAHGEQDEATRAQD